MRRDDVGEFRQGRPAACVSDDSRQARWGWKRWATWSGLGLLVVVVPFGWLLPVAHLARVRVTARRPRSF